MRDQPAFAIDDKRLAGIADLDLGDDLPDEPQIDFSDGDAGVRANASHRNGHERFGLAEEIDRSVVGLSGFCAVKRRRVRQIPVAADDIGHTPGDAQLFASAGVELCYLGDRRRQPQQADRVEAPFFECLWLGGQA